MEWGDVPTWVAAVGTVGTLAAALLQLEIERRHRRRVAHREQARLVSGWAGAPERRPAMSNGDRTAIHLANGSDEPVYNLVASLVYIQGAAPRTTEEWQRLAKSDSSMKSGVTTLSILPPGAWDAWIPGADWGVMAGRLGAEVAFTDRGGNHWVRRADGASEEIRQPAFEFFGLIGPYELQIPEPSGGGHPR